MIDFSKQLFRCSSLGAIMTNQQGKKDTKTVDELSETAKGELIKIYVEKVYGRYKDISNKYIEKGLAVEEDSITILSRVKEMFLKKNDQRFSNDYITGEPDVISPLIDTKSCWDIHTFYAAKTKPLVKNYDWQMQGYMDLLNANSGTVAFCLIDTPLGIVEQEKKSLYWRMNVATMENPDYLKACESLEKEMMFGDIPIEERVYEVTLNRSATQIASAYDRIDLCREWLNQFANQHEPKLKEYATS